MTNRRNFIKKATIASVAVALNPFQAESKENELGVIKSKVNKPI
ncbi:MAG: twin-arginine translocation signal domain-containing protein, partial [Flavobacteriaceae bacterium]|nr:twin-arginine translocation signal domain-containing protein [Flavobacteriaceae bacterium]